MQLSVLTDEKTFGPQGDGLINTYSFTDDGGFTNDHTSSVIDKESVINLRTGMNIDSGLAWNLSDLALGGSTWINMLVVLLLSPKVFALYKDYEEQMKAKKDPYYNPDKLCWKGVDVEMWKDINKKRIAEDK